MNDYGLKTINDFNGPIANLIKINNEYSKNGKSIKDFINVLRRPNKEEVLAEIHEYKGKTKTQRILEEEKLRLERANAFGIGI